jgi:hypothetical protein
MRVVVQEIILIQNGVSCHYRVVVQFAKSPTTKATKVHQGNTLGQKLRALGGLGLVSCIGKLRHHPFV